MGCPLMVPLHEAVPIPCHVVAVDWDADATFRQPGFDLQRAAAHIQDMAALLASTCLATMLVFQVGNLLCSA